MTATSDTPVDLAALRRAAAPVVAWYERFLAGQPMPLADLDRALADLGALPPMGGRLGRALATVGRAGRNATTDETIAALELLRHTPGLRHVPAPPAPDETQAASPAAATPRRRRRRRDWTQLPLPGMGGALSALAGEPSAQCRRTAGATGAATASRAAAALRWRCALRWGCAPPLTPFGAGDRGLAMDLIRARGRAAAPGSGQDGEP